MGKHPHANISCLVVLKKSYAMDSLGVIEQQFAAFRDKYVLTFASSAVIQCSLRYTDPLLDRLYDERLAQLSAELTLLTQPNSTHPEYLAMLHSLDVRREEKLKLDQILYEYKLGAIQTKHVAQRSQIHSQYYQTVRQIREVKLEEAGDKWYQIQRDRRGFEGSVSGESIPQVLPGTSRRMYPRPRTNLDLLPIKKIMPKDSRPSDRNRSCNNQHIILKFRFFPVWRSMLGSRPRRRLKVPEPWN